MALFKMKFSRKLITILLLLGSIIILAACTSDTKDSVPTNNEVKQTEIVLPIVESDNGDGSESSVEDQAYPDTELESQNLDLESATANPAYPEPEPEIQPTEELNIQGEDEPIEEVEPTQEPKPTSRGNQLAATDPSTVNLSSGNVQLVELFAFW